MGDGHPLIAKGVAESRHRGEGGQVELSERHRGGRGRLTDAGEGGFSFGRITDRQHDLGAREGQSCRDPQPDAVAAAGDDGPLSGQVGNGDVGGSAWHCFEPFVVSVIRLSRRPESPSRTRQGMDASGGSTVSGCRLPYAI
jgi:hypothetical protein